MWRFFVFALCLWATTAIGQSDRPRSPWASFGIFEISLALPEGPRIVRMIRFSNDEFMAEIEAKGTLKQHLLVRPSGLGLFSGLSDEESPQAGAKNPFMFLDYVFAVVVLALEQVYPSGAGAVPERETEIDTQVVVEKNVQVTLRTVREADHRIRYRVVTRSGIASERLTMDGTWDGRRRSPLPDDLQIGTWRHGSSASVSTLGEARALKSR
jgi:hypothetical protein